MMCSKTRMRSLDLKYFLILKKFKSFFVLIIGRLIGIKDQMNPVLLLAHEVS